MFCRNCGSQLPEGVAFCPNCGAPVSVAENIRSAADQGFDRAEQSLHSAVNEMKDTFGGNNGNNYAPNAGQRLTADRSLIVYILLSIITCGIYSYYFIYKLAYDINVACEGDGQSTGGLIKFILLSFITCGIYSWYWEYKIGNRLAANAPRYGLHFQENGTTILCWLIFGFLICGIGPYVAMHIIIKNTNIICAAYNRVHFNF